MGMYYDREGKPMDMMDWTRAFEDPSYKIIAQQKVGWGPGKKWVSTVWLGLDHQYGSGPPLIFESMVFVKGYGWHCMPYYCSSIYQDRYTNKVDAEQMHKLLVHKYQYNRRQRRKRLQLGRTR